MLWEVEIRPAPQEVDREGARVLAESRALAADSIREVRSARSFLIQTTTDRAAIERVAAGLLADTVVETYSLHELSARTRGASKTEPDGDSRPLLNVLFKPGVTDNVGQTAAAALRDLGLRVERVATCRKYYVNGDAAETDLARLSTKVLSNDAIEHVIRGPLQITSLALGSDYRFELVRVPIRDLNDDALLRLSREGQLYLSLAEMQTIQAHFRQQGRDPTDAELETIAQTWSEHCSHKTLAGRIAYRDERGERRFENMLKETIFAATQELRRQTGDEDWCVSVFKDNAGVVRFDDEHNVVLDMTLTSAACPLTDVIQDQTNTALEGLVNDVAINWVWMPPWGPDKITEDGREMLRALGFNV